jgi:hypothetical protein
MNTRLVKEDVNKIKKTILHLTKEDVQRAFKEAKDDYIKVRIEDIVEHVIVMLCIPLVPLVIPAVLIWDELRPDLALRPLTRDEKYTKRISRINLTDAADHIAFLEEIKKFLQGDGHSDRHSLKAFFCARLTKVQPKTNEEAEDLVASVLAGIEKYKKEIPSQDPEFMVAARWVRVGSDDPNSDLNCFPREISRHIAFFTASNQWAEKEAVKEVEKIFSPPQVK